MQKMNLTKLPGTDPLKIYRYRDGIYAVEMVILGVVVLDLFTGLASKPGTKAEICKRWQLADRPADVMLTLFTSLGFLKNKKGVFHATKLAREHLVKGSQWNLAPYYASLSNRQVCHDLIQVLRTDKAANWGSVKTEKEWARAMEEPNFAESFTAAMDCRGAYLGTTLANKLNLKKHSRLLDVAGGSGIYSCSLVANHPHIRATVLEKPPVNQIAAHHARNRGFADKVSVLAADMFADPWPTGFDLHLISNVLHDWDFPKVRHLLARCFEALEPGGMLIVHDAFINAAKNGPLPVAEYSVLLMHSTEGKCYSTREMSDLLKQAGFTKITHADTIADRGVMTARKPATHVKTKKRATRRNNTGAA